MNARRRSAPSGDHNPPGACGRRDGARSRHGRLSLIPSFATALGAHLTRGDPAPLVVAFSGGGDSLALLLMAKTWADANGRTLAAVTIDHRLRPESAEWTEWCKARAERLGVRHFARAWDEDKPNTGLPAAARRARHGLLAEAARSVGARVILMAHTADDRAEAAWMRDQGATTPTPRLWSPSPVWPAGHGIFLLRPLLEARRAELRAGLSQFGETWIDDPGNQDMASPRSRARVALNGSGEDVTPPVRDPCANEVDEGPAGDLFGPRELFLGQAGAPRLAAAVLCASGGRTPPRGESILRLQARIAEDFEVAATLGGARIIVEGDTVRFVRNTFDPRGEKSETSRSVNGELTWDGRFLIHRLPPGARVTHLAGHAAKLSAPLKRLVAAQPAATRRGLPLVVGADGALACPSLDRESGCRVTSLVRMRFLAARGQILDEATLKRMALSEGPP